MNAQLEAAGTPVTADKLEPGQGWGEFDADAHQTEVECPACGDLLLAEGNADGTKVTCGNDDCGEEFTVKLRPPPADGTLVPVIDN